MGLKILGFMTTYCNTANI